MKCRCVCGRTLNVPSRYSGLTIRCPQCGAEQRAGEERQPLPQGASAQLAARPVPPPFSPPRPPGELPRLAAAPPVPAVEATEAPAIRVHPPHASAQERASAAGFALVLLALLGLAPAVWEIQAQLQARAATGLPRWVYVVFVLGLLQFAYAAYVVQLPDWSSLWVVTGFTLLLASGYAFLLAITITRRPQAQVIEALELGAWMAGGRVAIWCLVMLALNAVIALASGHAASRWRRETS